MWTEHCVFLLLVTWVSGFINLAHDTSQGLQGTASMSEPPHKQEWSADKAVDGNTAQETLTTCAIMDWVLSNYKSVWWKVQLGKRFNVAYLEVFFRGSTITRASGYYFYSYDSTEVFDPISPDPNNLIYHHDQISGCPTSIKNITVNRLAQEIVFINKRPRDYSSSCAGDDLTKTTVEICEVKVMGCNEDRYSSNTCRSVCNTKCKDRHCDAFNGSCKYGCADSNALTIDCIVCPDGQYISNRQCVPCPGHCVDGAPCDKLTGRCNDGCSNYWTGEYCKTCLSGYYGNDCNTQCGKCAGNEMCDVNSGDCTGGCQGNWQVPKCNECKDRFYGYTRDCVGNCGHCKDNRICNKETGYCLGGCESNFLGPLCQVCIEGFYGVYCKTPCGNCLHLEICDKQNGTCHHGCINHFKMPLCAECQDGFYGITCNVTCGNCKDGQPCDKDTGECRNGCDSYVKPPLCKECQDGFYGTTCNVTCGNCKDGQPCDKDTGECMNGCDSYVKPPLCKEIISSKLQEERCTDDGTSFSWSYVVIGILGILLAIAVAFIVYLKRQRPVVQRDKQKTSTQNYDNLTAFKENHQYATMNSETNDPHYQELQETVS
uniref:Multiple epidermal growth factor-like domains protein 6 n=1 Tax=Crassostrea virginica TaxID=6565 RepID=A0A8B8BNC4_CRAVI|nr:multiple epidermal growth factor-like domains protein 6 [Crassostrea virginica]